MDKKELGIKTYSSSNENKNRSDLNDLFENSPIPRDQFLSNIGLFLESKNLSRILLMDFLFQKIVDIPGNIMEFGTRWGQNLVLFSALRGIYDPYNRHRKLIGFDTFKGFPQLTEKDGQSDLMFKGNLTVTKDYSEYLSKIMKIHENLNPLSHIEKFEIHQGDATKKVPEYFKDHPEALVSLAYFDFDLYHPTKECLEIIKKRLPKGAVVAFDELNDSDSPGETQALLEVFEINKIKLKRYRHASRVAYFIVGE